MCLLSVDFFFNGINCIAVLRPICESRGLIHSKEEAAALTLLCLCVCVCHCFWMAIISTEIPADYYFFFHIFTPPWQFEVNYDESYGFGRDGRDKRKRRRRRRETLALIIGYQTECVAQIQHVRFVLVWIQRLGEKKGREGKGGGRRADRV